MTDLEVGVVTTLLSSDGCDGYLPQIPHVEVVATWGIGSPSVDLVVRPGPARAADSTDRILVNGAVTDANDTPIGEVMLWVSDGWLSGIEYAWYSNERPHVLPDPEQIATCHIPAQP